MNALDGRLQHAASERNFSTCWQKPCSMPGAECLDHTVLGQYHRYYSVPPALHDRTRGTGRCRPSGWGHSFGVSLAYPHTTIHDQHRCLIRHRVRRYMWNEYLWPMVATTQQDMRVAQIGLRMLYTTAPRSRMEYGDDRHDLDHAATAHRTDPLPQIPQTVRQRHWHADNEIIHSHPTGKYSCRKTTNTLQPETQSWRVFFCRWVKAR